MIRKYTVLAVALAFISTVASAQEYTTVAPTKTLTINTVSCSALATTGAIAVNLALHAERELQYQSQLNTLLSF